MRREHAADRPALEPLGAKRAARPGPARWRPTTSASRNGALCRKEKSVCVEVDLDVAGRERADGERGQERPDPDRRGDADPLEDVEDEMHRAVP